MSVKILIGMDCVWMAMDFWGNFRNANCQFAIKRFMTKSILFYDTHTHWIERTGFSVLYLNCSEFQNGETNCLRMALTMPSLYWSMCLICSWFFFASFFFCSLPLWQLHMHMIKSIIFFCFFCSAFRLHENKSNIRHNKEDSVFHCI